MTATRPTTLHINKGKAVAQCLADRTDYFENAAKTEEDYSFEELCEVIAWNTVYKSKFAEKACTSI